MKAHDLHQTEHFQGVAFDPEQIHLVGIYADELSVFRARKNWSDTLESAFLLEKERDFNFSVERNYESQSFVLTCEFLTACGRYAFWRLTNQQAPEAQYEIETAHIPDSASRHSDFISAPDMKPLSFNPESDIVQGLSLIHI